MYRLDRKKTLVWVAVVVLLGYAFFNFYTDNTREATTDETTIIEQLAGRVSALEEQVAALDATVSVMEEQGETKAEEAEPTAEQAGKQQATKAAVAVQYLNVRTEPSEQALRIGVLTKDTEVEVLEKQGDWSKIHWQNKTNELTGWVASRFIAVKSD